MKDRDELEYQIRRNKDLLFEIEDRQRQLSQSRDMFVDNFEKGIRMINDDVSMHNLNSKEFDVYQSNIEKIRNRLRKNYDLFEEKENQIKKEKFACEEELIELEASLSKGEEDNGEEF